MNGYGRGESEQKKEKTSSIVSRETFGMTLLLFSAILFVITLIGRYMLGEIGVAITGFVLGIFGFFAYPLLLFCMYFGVRLVAGRKYIPTRWLLRGALIVCSVFLIVHLSTSSRFLAAEGGYGAYLGGCYNAAAEEAAQATGGGAVFGLAVYPLQKLLSLPGAYVVFSLLLAASVFLFLWATPLKKAVFSARTRASEPTPCTQAYKKSRQTEAKQPKAPEAPAPQPVNAAARQTSYSSAPAEADGGPSKVYPQGGYEQERRPMRGASYTAPYSEEFDRYTPPMEPSQPTDARDILFASDPARNYRSNLIYSEDSYFNSRARRNGGLAATSQKSAQKSASQKPAGAPQSYSEHYADRAERKPMPRKVVEQRPEQSSAGYAANELDYPRTPSYRAPAEPAQPEQRPTDYYRNDVPYEGLRTPTPPPAAEQPPRETRDEPFGGRSAEEARRDEQDELFDRRAAEETRRDAQDELFDSPAPPASEVRRERDPDADFRSLFSSRREEQPSGDGRDPGRESLGDRREDDLFARGSGPERGDDLGRESLGRESLGRESLGRDPFGDPAREDFGREDDFRGEQPRETLGFGRDAGESRAIGGLRSSAADLFDGDDAPEELPEDRIPAARGGERRTPQSQPPQPQKHVYKPYIKPSMALFRHYDDRVTVPQSEIERNSSVIVETLAGFGVDAEIIRVTVGPAVTRYDIDIPRNIAVSNVTKRSGEIAMRLHARDGVNMYANNEKGAISIEVPNSVRATVGLASVMEAEEYRKDKPGALMFCIGKDVEGRNVCGNIPKMTHILVAGTTNAGKSVALNAMLISLVCKYSPEELRLILVDPKKVEFPVYEGLPHLMINEIIADAQKAVTALNWAIAEMERRYGLFEQKTRSGTVVRNIDEYNDARTEDEQRMPKIVIVVDELADLMSVAKKDIEERIQRLTQKARAAGIHLVLATQRPSVDVITGVIKGNLPTRMAVRVIQEVDSRTILDESGAEKLLGMGDMLYKTGGMFNCLRVQGAFISSEEVQAVVEDIKAKNEAYFDESVADYINRTETVGGEGDDGAGTGGEANELYLKALGMVVKLGQASISLIQRKCSVGYNHAGKIIEWMELMGYVSPFDGKSKARSVLLTKEEYESKYGPLD